MGVALVTSMLLVTIKEEQVMLCLQFINPLTSCTLLTRESASVLKVGMPCVS